VCELGYLGDIKIECADFGTSLKVWEENIGKIEIFLKGKFENKFFEFF
jgi:hypothetical protein